MRPDLDELLHRYRTFQDDPVIYFNVSCQVHTVCQYHVIANDTVVHPTWLYAINKQLEPMVVVLA